MSSAVNCAVRSPQLLPFRYTALVTWIKYFKGFKMVMVCAHWGILLIGVNKPLISIMIIRKIIKK